MAGSMIANVNDSWPWSIDWSGGSGGQESVSKTKHTSRTSHKANKRATPAVATLVMTILLGETGVIVTLETALTKSELSSKLARRHQHLESHCAPSRIA